MINNATVLCTPQWINSICSLLGSMPYIDDTVIRKYPLGPQSALTLSNDQGNITVRARKQSGAILHATKRAAKPEHLEHLRIEDKINSTPNRSRESVTAQTKITAENIRGAVDYELIVPLDCALNLTTNRGNIMIEGTQAPVVARTVQGSVEAHHIKGSLTIAIEDSGNITLDHCTDNNRLSTHYGNIMVCDAHKNVIAQIYGKGNINVACAHMSPTNLIDLNTQSGSINLALPDKANASISGKTARGTLVCDHHITLNRRTTALNKSAWEQFRREVDGVIGKEGGKIALSSMRGNIKISKAQRTA